KGMAIPPARDVHHRVPASKHHVTRATAMHQANRRDDTAPQTSPAKRIKILGGRLEAATHAPAASAPATTAAPIAAPFADSRGTPHRPSHLASVESDAHPVTTRSATTSAARSAPSAAT